MSVEPVEQSSQLAALLGLINITLFEDLAGLAAVSDEMAERIRLDTLAAGLFLRFTDQTSGLDDGVEILERFAAPLQTFLSMTAPADEIQQDIRLLLLAGVQSDLAEALTSRRNGLPKALETGPELWRVIDHASTRIMAALAEDPQAVQLSNLFARRAVAECVVLFQTIAARSTEFSNELSGSADDGLADLAGVSATLEAVVAATNARLQRLGLNV